MLLIVLGCAGVCFKIEAKQLSVESREKDFFIFNIDFTNRNYLATLLVRYYRVQDTMTIPWSLT